MLKLDAGPSLFSVALPLTDGLTLDLQITGATIEADVVEAGDAIVFKNARLGGVIDAKTADTVRGLTLDRSASPRRTRCSTPRSRTCSDRSSRCQRRRRSATKYTGCRTPDIDVDGDGLEASATRPPTTRIKTVDVCIDGDGTEVDGRRRCRRQYMQCTEAEKDGKPRFVDGISVALKFETTAVKSIKPPR